MSIQIKQLNWNLKRHSEFRAEWCTTLNKKKILHNSALILLVSFLFFSFFLMLRRLGSNWSVKVYYVKTLYCPRWHAFINSSSWFLIDLCLTYFLLKQSPQAACELSAGSWSVVIGVCLCHSALTMKALCFTSLLVLYQLPCGSSITLCYVINLNCVFDRSQRLVFDEQCLKQFHSLTLLNGETDWDGQ